MLLRTEDEMIDFAYDGFLDAAQKNLSAADQVLFAMQFEEKGAVDIVAIQSDWKSHVGVGISEQEFCEIHIGLLDDNDNLADIFGRVLIKKQADDTFLHIIWKKD